MRREELRPASQAPRQAYKRLLVKPIRDRTARSPAAVAAVGVPARMQCHRNAAVAKIGWWIQDIGEIRTHRRG